MIVLDETMTRPMECIKQLNRNKTFSVQELPEHWEVSLYSRKRTYEEALGVGPAAASGDAETGLFVAVDDAVPDLCPDVPASSTDRCDVGGGEEIDDAVS